MEDGHAGDSLPVGIACLRFGRRLVSGPKEQPVLSSQVERICLLTAVFVWVSGDQIVHICRSSQLAQPFVKLLCRCVAQFSPGDFCSFARDFARLGGNHSPAGGQPLQPGRVKGDFHASQGRPPARPPQPQPRRFTRRTGAFWRCGAGRRALGRAVAGRGGRRPGGGRGGRRCGGSPGPRCLPVQTGR